MLPLEKKYLLTIPEASEYFSIGKTKLYEMTKRKDCSFAVHNGRNLLINRVVLEEKLKNDTFIQFTKGYGYGITKTKLKFL